MAVQWGLAGEGFDALQSLQVAGHAQQQRLQQQKQAAQLAAIQRQQQVAQQAGGLAASGDYAGARTAALGAGEFDIANHVGGLEEANRKQLAARAQTVGAIAVGLKGVPADQRAARFQALAPQLQQMGFGAQELAGVDLSDAGLDGYITFATNADDAIKAYAKSQEPVTLADGSQQFGAIDPVTGMRKLIAENVKEAPRADWIFDSDSGSWLQKPGTGTPGAAPLAQPGYAASGSGASTGGGAPRSVRNNNPGNIEDGPFARSQPGYRGSDGRFAIFDTPQAGGGAQAALLGSYIDRGYNTVAKIINRWAPPTDGNDTSTYARTVARALNVNPGDTLTKAQIPKLQAIISRVEGGSGPSSGETAGPAAQPGVINVRAPRNKNYRMLSAAEKQAQELDAETAYQIGPEGQVSAITGQSKPSDTRKIEADFRKEFEGLPEVKKFNESRAAFQSLRSLATNPGATAQDDIAVIFSFMKALDPTSTVREGEFATAQNAGGIPDTVRNAFNKAVNGERLNPTQRSNMVRAAYQSYKSVRDAYNARAERSRSYARDYGVNPDRVARTYTPDKPQSRRITTTITRID